MLHQAAPCQPPLLEFSPTAALCAALIGMMKTESHVDAAALR